MRLGLISDTHIPEAGESLPEEIYRLLKGVDYILHAGDMHVVEVLDWLERVAPVIAAKGDGDHHISYMSRDHQYRPLSVVSHPGVPEDPRIKESHVLEVEGLTIGLAHVFRSPEETPWETLGQQMKRVFDRKIDVVVCGHSHVAHVESYDGVMIVNPGSPTLPRGIKEPGTVGILEVNKGQAFVEIRYLA